jgi:hypothetical protein
LRACWATHAPVGWVVTPTTWTRRGGEFQEEQDVDPLRNTVSTVKKSQDRMCAPGY